MEAEGVRFASKLGFSLVANRNPLLVHKVLAALGDQGLPQKKACRARGASRGARISRRGRRDQGARPAETPLPSAPSQARKHGK